MKIAIYGRTFREDFADSIILLFQSLNKKGAEIYIYYDYYCYIKDNIDVEPEVSGFFRNHTELNNSFDFLFSVGGDGTFLESITLVRHLDIAIVGINSGKLGFLADISQSDIPVALQHIFNKEYSYGSRSLIELHTNIKIFKDFNYALNEVSVHKRDTSSMIKIHAYLDDLLMNSYWADGLIISTPTGSTAYSMSVGGPIVSPDATNFIIAPIAPHNLSVRPMVIPDNVTIKLVFEGGPINCLASLDYRSAEFNTDIEFVIKKADFRIKTISFENTSFYNTLRNKMMWGYDKRS